MPIDSVEIHAVPVTDPQRSTRFFRDVPGFERVREEPMGRGATIAWVTWFAQIRPGGARDTAASPSTARTTLAAR